MLAELKTSVLRASSVPRAKKQVCLIYTGGTLGMQRSDRGFVPAANLAELLAEKLPELRADSMPDYRLQEYDPPVDSANVRPKDWYDLSETIARLAPEYDGFVVIHGTDTLAYTASALSFLLQDLGKPIIVTGSQIPLCETRNDAHGNLLSAVQVLGSDVAPEVMVCFGRRLLRGNRARKVRSTGLDAFDSPNHPPLGEIAADIRLNTKAPAESREDSPTLSPPPYQTCAITVLPIFPGLCAAHIEALAATGPQGLILQCYGVGTAPDRDRDLLTALQSAVQSGTTIVALSQCIEGSVTLGQYAAGSALADCGVVSGHDMTTEAAFTKLHYLVATGLSQHEIERRMQRDLCGELTAPRPT